MGAAEKITRNSNTWVLSNWSLFINSLVLKLQNNVIESIALDSLNLNNSLDVVWLANNNLNNIKIDCSNNLWSNDNNPLSPAITLYQNELCAENPSNEYGGYCIENWLGVQNCD